MPGFLKKFFPGGPSGSTYVKLCLQWHLSMVLCKDAIRI